MLGYIRSKNDAARLLTFLFFLGFPGLLMGRSSQDGYPWNHQVVYLYTDLPQTPDFAEDYAVEIGARLYHETSLPAYQERRDLLTCPMTFQYRLSNKAFIRADWDVLYHREGTEGFRLNPGDLRLSTTIEFLKKPSLSVQWKVKLPNASCNYSYPNLSKSGGLSGAGTDNTDFHLLLLGALPLGPFMLHGSGGFLILGDPTHLSRQLDLATFAAGLAYPLLARCRLFLEWDATHGPRRFDDLRVLRLTVETDWANSFSLAAHAGIGLSGTEDDFNTGLSIRYKALRPGFRKY